MLKSKMGRTVCGVMATGLIAALLVGGCGNTDGGAAVEDNAGLGTQFVTDGGAGATIKINAPSRIPVATMDAFSVSLLDPAGKPLEFVRVNCDTEQGLAIIEPSKNGVAFEHTDIYGNMSGVLGGLAPGSFIIECRAPMEYQLVARASVVVTGDSPGSFSGWPGSAGGNLGGGVFVEPDPDTGGVRITSITYQDTTPSGGVEDTLYVDTYYTVDCDPEEDGNQSEYFIVNTYTLNMVNETEEDVFINSIAFLVGDGSGVTATQIVAIEIPANSEAIYIGQLTDRLPKIYAGTSSVVSDGTFPITFTASGSTAESGDSFSVSASQAVTFTGINNCPSS